MAEKEILIARFYIERKSWLSSANRAKAVVVKYPDTIWIKEALDIMLLSYQKLELKTLAADTQRVIDFNDFSNQAQTIDPDDYAKTTSPSL